ncbi:hypothetical protein FJN13_02180 [Alteromonas mediterranea]|uniref:DUF6624 domain-containing protein n=1 Tax=Alteromonas mediterranea TaxID=314275 RepID=UPI00112FD73C|nr:DUF6624 domain-containing protein [Alteromonas mediterranea]QDG33678.1 hypothetical protein FJN13_02180 [Alteromonas mediterranea]
MRLSLLIILFSFQCIAASNLELQKELVSMAKADQEVRNEIVSIGWKNAPSDLLEKMRLIDARNTDRLNEIVKKHSWVTEDLVGKKGVSAAFLIVQHSPDYKFQEEMLPLLKQSFLNGEGVTGQEFALLTDRVLVHQNKPQLYGTQLNILNGELVFDPILDKGSVNKRRAEVGLPSLEEYKKVVAEAYGVPVK